MPGIPSNCPSVHPEKAPGPCCICKLPSSTYIHLQQKKKTLPEFCSFVCNLYNITEKDCICKRCELKMKRKFQQQQMIPEDGPPAKVKHNYNINTSSVSYDLPCFLPFCTYRNSSIHNTTIKTFETNLFNKIFNIDLDTSTNSNFSISLCHQHYCKWIKKDSRFQDICIACDKTITGRQVYISDTQFNILTSLAEFDETSKNSTKPVMSTAAEEKDMPIDLLQIKTHFIPHPEENIFSRSRLLQRLFILSSIFHTQNNTCTQPLHMLITDTADKFSNSSTDFLAILSRFGICVSKDTHKRFLSDVVEQNNTTESTPFKSFAIGSYDNIDKNQVHSSVTAGKSNSGFHGTSVQIVEPLPETLLHSVTNSSSENSILETTDPLTTLLNSSSTSEMSTSSSEILTLSSEILTSSEFFTSNVIPTSSSVISTSNTEISTKCIQQGENTNSISSSCDSSPVKNDILDTIPNLDNSHYKKYSETSHIRSSKRNMSSELLKNLYEPFDHRKTINP
ncbi:unnamed protein product [Mytilus edulis]|uniref:Uncharacterized protein n=1 Tax=Mytilus edulis TaxID=6550 RepID=A0A8S3PUB4_MYTED|nr:unnamed protein product [Mytilus edulis]